MMNKSEKKQEFNEKYSQLIAKIKEKGSELYRLETSDRNQPFYVRVYESTNDLEIYTGPGKNKSRRHLKETQLHEYILYGVDKNKPNGWLPYYRGVLKALDLSFSMPEHNGAPEHPDEKERVVVTINGKEYTLVVDEDSGDTEYKLKDDKPSSFNARKIDQAKKAENNKKTGDIGEKLAFAHERQRVSGKYKDKVKHYSADKGDGLGYDILSVTEIGEEKYIEVKATTEKAFNTPFFVTVTELAWCKKYPDQYYLYRVYNLNEGPARLRVIRGRELIRLIELRARPASYKISLEPPA